MCVRSHISEPEVTLVYQRFISVQKITSVHQMSQVTLVNKRPVGQGPWLLDDQYYEIHMASYKVTKLSDPTKLLQHQLILRVVYHIYVCAVHVVFHTLSLTFSP